MPCLIVSAIPPTAFAATTAPQLIETGVDGDPREPGRKLGPAVEIGDSREGLEECVLGRGVGLRGSDVLPAHHPNPPLVTVDQLAEGLAVTALCPQHQLVIRPGKIGSRRMHGHHS